MKKSRTRETGKRRCVWFQTGENAICSIYKSIKKLRRFLQAYIESP